MDDERCFENLCDYQEPHKHGFACGSACYCKRRKRYAAALNSVHHFMMDTDEGPESAMSVKSAEDLADAAMAVADAELKKQAFETAKMLADSARGGQLRAELSDLRKVMDDGFRLKEGENVRLAEEVGTLRAELDSEKNRASFHKKWRERETATIDRVRAVLDEYALTRISAPNFAAAIRAALEGEQK